MLESNFLKEFRIANFTDFQAKLEYSKNAHPEQFSKINFETHFHPGHH